MKKIINGRLYDTDKAELLTIWNNGFPYSDLSFVEESLYRTNKGKYFLYCEGGPNSEYFEWDEGNRRKGETIRPLTSEEARAWGEKHMTVESYIKEFGEVDEA